MEMETEVIGVSSSFVGVHNNIGLSRYSPRKRPEQAVNIHINRGELA